MSALAGITVLDLTRVLSGPYCTMALGDHGARVIKVEHPQRGDDTRQWGPPFLGDESAYFLSVNRNKESITVDFKQPAGREVIERLLTRADVVVENFRPGTLGRAGLDGRAVLSRFPRLVYCSIAGFGQTGPRRDEPGYDAVMQAEGGLMSITGDAAGSPFRLGVAIVDIVSGLFAAQGIMAALLAREKSGRGQLVDISMLDATVALLTYQAGNFFATQQVPGRLGNRHPTIVPYESFTAADGEFVIACGNDQIWQRLCGVLERPDLAADERFRTNKDRAQHYNALKRALTVTLGERSRAAWVVALTAAGVPAGSVRDIGEVLADPQLAAREMLPLVEHSTLGPVPVVASPVKLTDTPTQVRLPPPVLGEHTDAILAELGYDHDERRALRSAGAV